jgi:hypothetical protein
MKWLQGKKTYIAGGALMGLAVFGHWAGALSDGDFVALFSIGLGFIGVRSGIARNHAVQMEALQRIEAALPAPPKKLAAAAGSASGKSVAGMVAAEIENRATGAVPHE